MIACYVESVGLAAPGLANWAIAQAVLCSRAPLRIEPEPPFAPNLLPPNERRRATATIRQAFRAGEDALSAAAPVVSELATVFACADGDLAVLNRLCTALAKPARQVSPTDFHNSVHNAASGYFSIAIRSMAAATTVAAFDASFAAGLLEAATLATVEGCEVLLIAYDVMAPAPLLASRPLTANGSCALLLTAERTGASLARLGLELGAGAESVCADAALEELRRGCPALRSLPLLTKLATRQSGACVLALGAGRMLQVTLD